MKAKLLDNEYEFLVTLPQDAAIKLRLDISRPHTVGGETDAVTRILGGIA